MKKEWRFSVEESHALFYAFWENAENPRLKTYAGFGGIAIWLEMLKGGHPLVVAPSGQDEEFFPALVERELIRLSVFDPGYVLPTCGCGVLDHRKALQQFRLKNF